MLKTETRQEGGITILSVIGEVQSAQNDAFSAAVEGIKDGAAPGTRVAVDVTRLDYLNSRGLGELVALYTRLRGIGGGVVLAGARPGVLKVLRLTGLGELLENYPDLGAAIGALESCAGTEPK